MSTSIAKVTCRVSRVTALRLSATECDGLWDAVRVNQLLSNLVRNALQHGGASAPVIVRAIGEPERAVFEVHNVGEPIPPTLMPHLFEPLVHGNRTSQMDAHSGSMRLGLYIAYTIAKAHRRTRIQYREADKALMWERWRPGESLHTIARLFEVSQRPRIWSYWLSYLRTTLMGTLNTVMAPGS